MTAARSQIFDGVLFIQFQPAHLAESKGTNSKSEGEMSLSKETWKFFFWRLRGMGRSSAQILQG
jgi:hypothetical protein